MFSVKFIQKFKIMKKLTIELAVEIVNNMFDNYSINCHIYDLLDNSFTLEIENKILLFLEVKFKKTK